jgi:LemA protein
MTTGRWIALAVVVLVILAGISSYNGLVTKDEAAKAAWSEVQNSVKRRHDLIPNLVNAVKGIVGHEHSTFTELAEARAKVGQFLNVDASKLANDPVMQKRFLEAQNSMSASLGRLIAVAENYPQLKSNENFLQLQNELAGTENRVSVARGRAIKANQYFNASIRTLPTSIVARLGGFTAKQYYEAPVSEQEAPVIDFGK